MAYKTTTLKTKTNDNVYPKVIGESINDAFVDSSTITHHLYEQTHKVGFQIANATNIKIQNSLQKPAGLTKTELVGVGANGQENIEIGDNLTLANGKLSATGGGSGGGDFEELTFSDDWSSVTGTITGTKPVIINHEEGKALFNQLMVPNFASSFYGIDILDNIITISMIIVYGEESFKQDFEIMNQLYSHFITMTDSSNNVVLYLTIQNISDDKFTSSTLAPYLAYRKVMVNGNLHGSVPTYIYGDGNNIKVYYMNPGDNNINPEPDVYSDLSSFTIDDIVKPVR